MDIVEYVENMMSSWCTENSAVTFLHVKAPRVRTQFGSVATNAQKPILFDQYSVRRRAKREMHRMKA